MKRLLLMALAILLLTAFSLPAVCDALKEDSEELIYIRDKNVHHLTYYPDSDSIIHSITFSPNVIPSATQIVDGFEYLTFQHGCVAIVNYHGMYKPSVLPDTLDGKPVKECLSDAFDALLRTCGDYEYYPLSETEGELAGYSGSQRVLTLPTQLDGYNIIGVGNEAFSWSTKTEVIEIPGTIKYIGDFAFLMSASYFVLNEGTESIGDGAFVGCDQEILWLPQSIRHIGVNPFYDDPNLGGGMKAYFHDYKKENPYFLIQDGMLCSKEDMNLIAFFNDEGDEVAVPEGIRSIGDLAFICTNGIRKITLPDTVERIGFETFMFCNTLEEINLPESITYIDREAFSSCYHLTCTVSPDSYAESYCRENEVPFRYP